MRCISVFLMITASVLAESPFERELSQLGAQREREIGVAMEPINRRYKESLELLLRRAIQANDLDAALKVRETIATVGSTAPVASSPPAATGSGSTSKVELTKRGLESRLDKTTWATDSNNWLRKMVIEDGKVIHNPNDKGQGRSAKFHAVDGATIVYQWDGKPCTITFSPDLSNCMRGNISYKKQ